jgi:REP element-mobilizing transposase RayT
MPKPVPLQHGKYYHIYNRGNNREDIFLEDRNYRHFLKLYAKYVAPIVDTYAYCLLRNHFHFLVRVKDADMADPKNPSRHLSNLFNAYAKAFNKAYSRAGSLFQRPFGRIEIGSDAHFVWLVMYIHQNPQRHGLVDDFRDWPYSSYRAFLSTQPTRLRRAEVLEWFGGERQFVALHEQEVTERRVARWFAET